MTFAPGGWLAVASHCKQPERVGNEGPEAWLRSTANRAFYAALMAVGDRIMAEQGAAALPAGRTHTAIKNALKSGRNVRVIRELRDELTGLEELRDLADYDLDSEFDADAAQEALERGNRLVEKIGRLNGSYFARLTP